MEILREQRDNLQEQDEIYRFIKNELPKIELHAHLNGCIPSDLLRQLAQERHVTLSSKFDTTTTTTDRGSHHHRSLQDCFEMFRELPNVINDLSALSQITMAALQQFAHHHSTLYLELRTTPKRLLYRHDDDPTKTKKCTKREYMETILRTLQQFEETDRARYEHECHHHAPSRLQLLPRLPMTVRLLISVDRSQSLSEATEHIDLAVAMYQDQAPESYVVGVDLGGNPHQNANFGEFESLFHLARRKGLKVTIHCAEVECPSCHHGSTTHPSTTSTGSIIHSKEYQEIQQILQFRPDRIGHGVLLPKDLLTQLDQLRIPVETCPTSNVLTLEMFHCDDDENDGDNHHAAAVAASTTTTNRIPTIIHGLQQYHYTIRHWLTNRYPIIICTDDPGIFDTTITDELYIVHQAFQGPLGFSRRDLIQIVEQSMDHAFCSESTRTKIKHAFQQRIRTILEMEEIST